MIAAIGRYSAQPPLSKQPVWEVAMPKIIDITGQRFGKLVVLARHSQNARRDWHWLCQCDCGRQKPIAVHNLVAGKSRSCGVCIRKGYTRHGHSPHNKWSGTYVSWRDMILRCTYPKSNRYEYYGGRGIIICERWLSFPNFLADMGERPPGHSIERINVNGNYEPSNCKWIPRAEQSKNRRYP